MPDNRPTTKVIAEKVVEVYKVLDQVAGGVETRKLEIAKEIVLLAIQPPFGSQFGGARDPLAQL